LVNLELTFGVRVIAGNTDAAGKSARGVVSFS
jgi:hypothetical protein